MSPKQKGLVWVLAISAAAASFAYGLPFAVAHMPWSWETRLADGLKFASHYPVCSDGAAGDAALRKLWTRIFPLDDTDQGVPARVRVVRSMEVNAFATLGGEIYVNDGLLLAAESPDEVAGVVAHEIEHVKRRHVMDGIFFRLLPLLLGHEGIGRLAEMFGQLKFSRLQEAEADLGGFERLRRAHVSLAGIRGFFERLAKASLVPAILSDHPGELDRARSAGEDQGPTVAALGLAEWEALKKICR